MKTRYRKGVFFWAVLLSAIGLGMSCLRTSVDAADAAPPPPVVAPSPNPNPTPGAETPVAPVPAPVKKEKKPWKLLTPDLIVPENAVLYATAGNYKRLQRDYQHSGLSNLMTEGDVGKKVLRAFARFRESIIEGDGTRTTNEINQRRGELELLKKFLGLADGLDGPLALSIQLDPTDKTLDSFTGGKPMRYLFVMTFPGSESGEKRAAEVSRLMDNYSAGQLLDSRVSSDSRKVGPYEFQEITNSEFKVYQSWAFVENLFLFGQGQGVVEEALKAYHLNKSQGTLSQNPGYVAAFSRVGEDSHVYFQADLIPFQNLLAGNWMTADIARNLANLGVKGPHIAGGLRIKDGEKADIVEKFLIKPGLLGVPQAVGASKASTAFVSTADALTYHTHQGTLNDFLKRWLSNFAVVRDADGKPVSTFIADLQRVLGKNSAEEVYKEFSPFKGEMGYFISYAPGENLADAPEDVFQTVMFSEFNSADEGNVLNVLAALTRGTKQDYKKITFQGRDIYYQQGASADERRGESRNVKPMLGAWGAYTIKPNQRPVGDEFPFFVAYTILEGTGGQDQGKKFLYVSDSLLAIKSVVQQHKIRRYSLGERPEFQTLSSQFNEARHEFYFMDLKALSSAMFNTLLPSLASSNLIFKDAVKELPFESLLKPDLSVAMGLSFTSLNEGELAEFVSPTGMIPLTALLGATTWPAMNAENQKRISDQVQANLKQISLALHLYAAAHNDRFPNNLSQLVEEGFVEKTDVFQSPFSKEPLALQDVDDPLKTNLVYNPGKTVFDLSNEILVYEIRPTRMEISDDGLVKILHQVLLLDCRVRSFTRENLNQKTDKKLNEYLVKVEKKRAEAQKNN